MVDCKGCLRSSTIVHFLVLMFGAGAWIAVNGVWVELPLIVHSAPEQWNLPSYLTIIAQVANVGPLLVTLMQILCPKYFHQNAMIYSILFLGTTSCLLLSFFWDEVTPIAGQSHSLALFILWFALAFVDCTSSVTFLPFMTTFQALFLTTYFIGEGLSGLLPSIFALIQGVQDVNCVNKTIFNETTNATEYVIVQEQTFPRYSVDVFFILLCIMMLACSVSFILLNYLGVARKFFSTTDSYPDGLKAEDNRCYYNSVEMQVSSSEGSNIDNPNDAKDKNNDAKIKTVDPPDKSADTASECLAETLQPPASTNIPVTVNLRRRDYVYLLLIIALINGVANGILPSVSSYSSLPYGSVTYHLAACLGNMANPVACFIAVFLPMHSFCGLGFFVILSMGFGSYLLFLAIESPCPILVHEDIGKALMVLAQIFFVGFVSFVKVSIAQIFRNRGHKRSLVWYGAAVQAGSLVGACIMFPLVNVLRLFVAGLPCQECP